MQSDRGAPHTARVVDVGDVEVLELDDEARVVELDVLVLLDDDARGVLVVVLLELLDVDGAVVDVDARVVDVDVLVLVVVDVEARVVEVELLVLVDVVLLDVDARVVEVDVLVLLDDVLLDVDARVVEVELLLLVDVVEDDVLVEVDARVVEVDVELLVLVDVEVVVVVLVVVGGADGFSSYAPLSQSELPFESPSSTRGKPVPRWSVVRLPGQLLPPTSMAGLPGTIACVSVGPPLFWSGVRSGFLLTWSPAPNPHVLPLSRFPPSDVSEPPEPPQLPPEVAFATIVLPIVRSLGLKRSPPRFAPLLASVTLFSVAVMSLISPPPSVTAVLPLIVTFVRVSVPSFWMPPPDASEVLPLTVTRVSVATPVL